MFLFSKDYKTGEVIIMDEHEHSHGHEHNHEHSHETHEHKHETHEHQTKDPDVKQDLTKKESQPVNYWK